MSTYFLLRHAVEVTRRSRPMQIGFMASAASSSINGMAFQKHHEFDCHKAPLFNGDRVRFQHSEIKWLRNMRRVRPAREPCQ
jgi:hypothetical protein